MLDGKRVLFAALLLISAASLASAAITVSSPWVEIHQNAADTQEVSIGVSGFGWLEDVGVKVDLNGLEGQKEVG